MMEAKRWYALIDVDERGPYLSFTGFPSAKHAREWGSLLVEKNHKGKLIDVIKLSVNSRGALGRLKK